MRALNELIKIIKDNESILKSKYKVRQFKVFGSYARGEQKEDSDLDILVDFDKVPSLLTFVRLKNDLEDLLDMKVDLLIENNMRSPIKKYIDNVITL